MDLLFIDKLICNTILSIQASPADYEKAIAATKAAWDTWVEVCVILDYISHQVIYQQRKWRILIVCQKFNGNIYQTSK